MLRYVLLLAVPLLWVQYASAAIVRIADNDCSGLATAVSAAAQNASGATTILLSRKGVYSNCNVNFSGGSAAAAVTIDGQGAVLQLPTIASTSGSFTLRNVSIGPAAGGTVARLAECAPSWAAIACVSGSVMLETVSIGGLGIPSQHIDANGFADSVALIYASGSLVLRNVTVANLSLDFGDRQTQYQSAEYPAGIAMLQADGNLEIYNSTFTNMLLGTIPAPLISDIVLSGADASHLPKIANSVFAANNLPICNLSVHSLGGNVTRAPDCGFSVDLGDKIGADASLGSFADHGGLVPTQAISADGAAQGAGIAQYCEAVDARGYTRSPHGCDAGAYEYGGGLGSLTANGLNGFYYDPSANGNYVSLQGVHDNGDIAVLWSTFDSFGNQAWIYGVGQLVGKHIHVGMAQNIGGVLQVGGPPTGSTVRSWGSVDIDLTSCALAQFSYQSNLEGFGSGQFPLTRLAFASGFGCSD